MDSMQVPKLELVEILVKNRNAHRSSFLTAQESYRKHVILELDKMLTEAREGGPIRRRVNMAAPIDRTNDYDQMLGLLAMSNETMVALTLNEYTCYVKDNWAWGAKVYATHTAYNTSPFFVAEDASLPSSY